MIELGKSYTTFISDLAIGKMSTLQGHNVDHCELQRISMGVFENF